MIYRNRRHAGMLLAQALIKYSNRSDVTVLALPRGGVPVGCGSGPDADQPRDGNSS
jgi:putative phosphoribosyl transferase